MSLDLSPDAFEIRSDVDDRLVLNHLTKLVPAVQSLTSGDIDVVFPSVSKYITEIMRSGSGGTSSSEPDGRSWRSYAWGLGIQAGTQSGSINLAPIGAGLAPNLLMANMRCQRVGNPNESVYGPFTKSVPENVWIPVRSGLRLEFNAWMRRIVWLSIEGGFLKLNWKQSSATYNPNSLDPNWSWSWPERNYLLAEPPGHQLGFNYRRGPNDEIFPPSTMSPPASVTTAMNAINFASTWRFRIKAKLMQL